MSFLLLDECVAKCCADGGVTYTAQRSIEVKGLGQEAEDLEIYNYVLNAGCILVTLNGRDFAALAARYKPISVVVLPAVEPKLQHEYLLAVIGMARAAFERDARRFVEVSREGRVISYVVRQGVAWQQRYTAPSERPRPFTLH